MAYRGTDDHIHQLQWSNDAWTHSDLTAAAGAPQAAPGTLAGYAFNSQSTLHFDFTGADGHIHELWRDDAIVWYHNDLSTRTGAPPAISSPFGYLFADQKTQHVAYTAADHHVVELWWTA